MTINLRLAALAALALLAAAPCRATNPCDISEKACEEWKKAMEDSMRAWRQSHSDMPQIPARACDANPALCEPAAKTVCDDAALARRDVIALLRFADGTAKAAAVRGPFCAGATVVRLPDGSVTGELPAFSTTKLAAGGPVDLGEVWVTTFAKDGGTPSSVRAHLSLFSRPARR